MTTGSTQPRCKTNSVTKSMRRLMKGISSWLRRTIQNGVGRVRRVEKMLDVKRHLICVLYVEMALKGSKEERLHWNAIVVGETTPKDGIKAEADWRPYPPTCVLSKYRRERVETASRLIQIYRDLLLKSPTVLMGPQFLFKTMKDAGIGDIG
ncbi:hypothetical protein V1478_013727 [Vespula squamosa]|uniref:Uncharacterized protein n=1 Tax=Vespula squamosa TaxID=30214 RepID=A0ABD2A629_VESSQ